MSKVIPMKCFKLPLFAMLAVAAVPVVCGPVPVFADQVSHGQYKLHPYAIRDTKVDPHMSPAARARVQRDATIKRKQDVRTFVQNVMEGKGPESKPNNGGAK